MDTNRLALYLLLGVICVSIVFLFWVFQQLCRQGKKRNKP